MTMRSRKFVGMFLLAGFIAVYAIAVMAFAVDVMGDIHKLAELLFYVIAGIAWIFPARFIIAWMQKPDAS